MKKLNIGLNRHVAGFAIASLLALGSLTAMAGGDKVITKDFESVELDRLSLEAHVGSVKISASDDQKVHVFVKVSESQSQGWNIFSESIEDVELEVQQNNGELRLSLTDDNFGEQWKIELPKDAGLDLALGVGSVNIDGISSEIRVEVGVGDVKVIGLGKEFSAAKIESGVGGASISASSGEVKSRRTMTSETSNWHGSGQHQIVIDVGIGEASLSLK